MSARPLRHTTQEPLDDEERVLMDPSTWDWDKTEVGRNDGTHSAVLEVRLARDELLALNLFAQQAGIGPVEYTRQTMVRHILEAGSSSTPERLAYWYFRLNGFMTIENFLVHPETGSEQRTEADVLATRFKLRRENIARPMIDDPQVAECETFANIIIAEITEGQCKLNGPWTKRECENMQRVLRAMGCAREEEISFAAESLYEHGRWSNDFATVRLFAVGERKSDNLIIGPDQQLEWTSVIDFCVDRLKKYRRQKASNGQWAADGRELMRLATRRANGQSVGAIRRYFGLNRPGGTN